MLIRNLVRKFDFLGRLATGAIPSRKDIVILTLHNIAPNEILWFENVVQMINEKYGFISPQEMQSKLKEEVYRTQVVLSFDDGFLSNRRVAELVLSKYDIKAMFFITKGFIGLKGKAAGKFAQAYFYPQSHIELKSDGQCDAMDWEDIYWLRQEGHVIGAHTATHPILSRLSWPEKQKEIIESADLLEKKLGDSIRYFAYPFGRLSDVDDVSLNLVTQRFELAFANVRGGVTKSYSDFFLFRQNLVPGMPLWLVSAIVEGKLDWKYAKVRRDALNKYQHAFIKNNTHSYME